MLFNKKLFKFIDFKIDTWEEALKIGVETLVENQYCTFELYDKILDSVKKYGPYFVLVPRIALAHAEHGDWCKKVGVSLTIFKESVKFSNDENHNVRIIFTLSAIDSDSHMSILKEFVEKIGNETFKNKILSLNNENDILKELFNNENY